MGTMIVWSYDDITYEYLWMVGTKQEVMKNLYNKISNKKRIILHQIKTSSFDEFIRCLENNHKISKAG